jgi:hypothetical protein
MAIQSQERNQSVGQKTTLAQEELIQFGKIWYERLNRHADVEELLPMVSDTLLEMVFPDSTIQNHNDFRTWYEAVGRTYYDQDHTVEKFDITISDAARIDVIVVWKSTKYSDNTTAAFRIPQTWILTKSLTTSKPVITKYIVHSFAEVK